MKLSSTSDQSRVRSWRPEVGIKPEVGGQRSENREVRFGLFMVSVLFSVTLFFLHFSLHRSSVGKPCPLLDRSGNFSEFLSGARSSTGANGANGEAGGNAESGTGEFCNPLFDKTNHTRQLFA